MSPLAALLLLGCAAGTPAPGSSPRFREELTSCPSKPPLGTSFYWPASASGPIPLAVVLVGAQPWNRYGDLATKPWSHYRDIAEALASAGTAVLLFDKGGTGETGGRSPEFADRVNEAVAAVACGRARTEVGSVVLVGHSQGAAVALAAAPEAVPDRIVLLAPGAGLPDFPAGVPVAIIQPTGEASPSVKATLIPGVNHLFLREPARAGTSRVDPQALAAIVAAVRAR